MTLQQQIIEELRVLPTINVQEEIRKSIDFLKEYAQHYSFVKGFVLGISGGQDSTLTGKLAQLAIDELNAEAGEMKYSFWLYVYHMACRLMNKIVRMPLII